MKHALRPLFDRIVIKELEPERFRRSGLLVPAGSNEPPPQHGIVLAVGQGLDWWDHVGVRMPIAPQNGPVRRESSLYSGKSSTIVPCRMLVRKY